MPVTQRCDAVAIEDRYFGGQTFGSQADKATESRRYYAKPLAAIGEPPLACGNVPEPSYRLFAIGFQGLHVVVRIATTDTGGDLTVVEDDNGTARRTRYSIAAEEWKTLNASIALMDLWSRPMYPVRGLADPVYLDAPAWLLEARDLGRYRIVFLDFAKESEPVRSAWRQLFDVAKLVPPPELLR